MRLLQQRGLGCPIALAHAVVLIALTASIARAVPAMPDERAVKRPHELVASAMAYAQGEGVIRDQQTAALLYCAAARGGDIDAMFTLGWMYADGAGIARDNAAASALFARAAELGHAHAAEILAIVGENPQALPECMVAANPAPAQPVSAAALDDNSNLKPDSLQVALSALSAKGRSVADVVLRIAPMYQIDPRLALALIKVESNFEPLARSVKNARGIMQLTPDTAARFNVENLWDVQENVRGGLAYLRWLLAYYEGEVALVTAAYNAGEAAVDKYGGVPPYPETRAYVLRVQRLFGSERHPYDRGLVRRSPIIAHSSAAP